MRPILLISVLTMLSACGTKTLLTLPPGPAQPPLLGNATPAAATPAKTADDNKPARGAEGK